MSSIRYWAIAIMCVASTVIGAEHYLDPVNGSLSGDGTIANPWGTLQEVIEADLVETMFWASLPYTPGATLVVKNPGAPIKAGDTLWLLDGYHGDVVITGAYNTDWITIAAAPGHQPRLRHLLVRAASKWRISGLHLSVSYGGDLSQITMLEVRDHSYSGPLYDVVVSDCQVSTVDDASGWSMSDWDTLASSGIIVTGDSVTVRDNVFRNVNFGISVTGDNCLVERNTVENFSGDGMRGLGDYGTYQYNVVRNSYDVNANHDDGFQSWSVGSDGQVGTGTVYGVTLRGNFILNYSDPAQPFASQMQGIGCFDGMYEDWVIENNVIVTDHWHGITLSGCVDCLMINNTVVDRLPGNSPRPWIRFGNHKNGTPSSGCVMRNNLTVDINNDPEGNTIVDHNLEYSDPTLHFLTPPDGTAMDLHLLQTSTAVDAGSALSAPAIDADGIPRPQGSGIDIGAYEWTSMMFADGFEIGSWSRWSAVSP